MGKRKGKKYQKNKLDKEYQTGQVEAGRILKADCRARCHAIPAKGREQKRGEADDFTTRAQRHFFSPTRNLIQKGATQRSQDNRCTHIRVASV